MMFTKANTHPQILRHRIDIVPVCHVLAVLVLQMSCYLSIGAWWVLLIVAIVISPLCFSTIPITHNHFHVSIFRHRLLNCAVELVLFFQNGFTEGTWKPTHLLHHKYYLNQDGLAAIRDPNAWVNERTGEKLTLWPYCACFVLSHWKRHPGASQVKLGSSLTTRVVRLLIMSLLVVGRPLQAMCIFIIPMVISQILTAIHSYYQHAGLDTSEALTASKNYHGPAYLYNIGYHTAHHLKPGLHWSKLPNFHREIEDQIPDENIVRCYLRPCRTWFRKDQP